MQRFTGTVTKVIDAEKYWDITIRADGFKEEDENGNSLGWRNVYIKAHLDLPRVFDDGAEASNFIEDLGAGNIVEITFDHAKYNNFKPDANEDGTQDDVTMIYPCDFKGGWLSFNTSKNPRYQNGLTVLHKGDDRSPVPWEEKQVRSSSNRGNSNSGRGGSRNSGRSNANSSAGRGRGRSSDFGNSELEL